MRYLTSIPGLMVFSALSAKLRAAGAKLRLPKPVAGGVPVVSIASHDAVACGRSQPAETPQVSRGDPRRPHSLVAWHVLFAASEPHRNSWI